MDTETPANAPAPVKLELSANVSPVQQGDTEFLTFTMTATALARLAHPLRFSEDPTRGVQRDLDEKQILAFMGAMEAGRPVPTNFTLNLTGDWVHVDGELYGMEGFSTIEALDGQHRGEAARRLVAAGKTHITDRYSFVVMAVHNAPDALRRQLFLAQVGAKAVSREHEMAVRRRADFFDNDGQRVASAIVTALNERQDSPLFGHVHEGDVLRGPRRRRELPGERWVTFSSLQRAVVESLTGKTSIVSGLDTEGKIDFAVALVSAAKECYPTQFQPSGTLRTAFGLKALFLLAARKQGTFRTLLKEGGLTRAKMMELFSKVPRFQWTSRTGANAAGVVERFNERLDAAVGTPS